VARLDTDGGGDGGREPDCLVGIGLVEAGEKLDMLVANYVHVAGCSLRPVIVADTAAAALLDGKLTQLVR